MAAYLPTISKQDLQDAQAQADPEVLYSLLVDPLHEELYRRQDFTFLDSLTPGQQLLLTFDYVRQQVGQGGFIQLIQNGYIPLLPPLVHQLQQISANEMAQVLDDALKVFVLNRELLDRQTTVEEFAALYEELKEFEVIDKRFEELHDETVGLIINSANTNLADFADIK